MINGNPFTAFFADPGFSESKIFFGQGKCPTVSQPAGRYASRPAQPGGSRDPPRRTTQGSGNDDNDGNDDDGNDEHPDANHPTCSRAQG